MRIFAPQSRSSPPVSRPLMNRPLLSASLLVFFAAGCVRFSPKPIDAGLSATRLGNRRIAAKTWTLKALVTEAVQHHPDVAWARAQYHTAKAAIRTAGERPNPTVLIAPQIVTPIHWIAGTYGVDFDWTVETAGKRARRIDVSHAQVRAAACRVVDATWKVRSAVRKALLDLFAAQRRAALLTDAIAKQEELLRTLDIRVKAGALSGMEVSVPRLLSAQLRIQAADAAKGMALGRVSLAEALGMSVSGLHGATFSFAGFETAPGSHPASRRAALTHRADILAALADYAAAEALLRLEVAKQYPDVHLSPGYSFDGGANKWGLGVGLTLPILNQNQGAIGEAEGKRREAAAKFDVVQAKAIAECDRAVASVSAARAKLALAADLLAEQARRLDAEERLVAAGEGDKLSLFNAQVERATTAVTRLDALVELHAALGSLEEAMQSPSEK